MSFGLTDRLMVRFLRSMLMIIASTVSPSFRCVRHVFHAVARDFGCAQIAFDFAGQLDHRALGSTDLTVPVTTAPLSCIGDEVVERIAFELLDAQRDALALDVDRQHHGFEFVALLEAAHGFFAGSVQDRSDRCTRPSMLPGRPMNTPKSVIDLIAPRTLSPFLWVDGEVIPWVGLALLHAERDTATLFVDLQNHDFDFVAELDNLVTGATFLLVQSISETWTRPSMPCSTSTNAP